MNLTQQRFLGFQKTSFLWKKELMGLNQIQFENYQASISDKISNTIRLGNYVERLVSYVLSKTPNIKVLEENIQIISNKVTLGEIDCLLLQDENPIHLEIAYKFYLYDPMVGNTFLEHWIGPNRRDSLLLKLNKIKEKQFPLLYSDECRTLLSSLHLDPRTIQQQTYFKAQLYIPYEQKISFSQLNQDCVSGFYIPFNRLSEFSHCKFYIPTKLDWIIEPHTQVDWLRFEYFKERIHEFHQKKSAPLCWMKLPNGEIQKLFVVWW